MGKVLYLGDGRRRSAEVLGPIIKTVAGNGVGWGGAADGDQATKTAFPRPSSVAAAPDGGFYVTQGNRIKRVSADGVVSTTVQLPTSPRKLIFAADGNLYADAGYRIYKVTPQGQVTSVVGNGSAGHSGDGGPATNASIYDLAGFDVGPDGSIYMMYDDNWDGTSQWIRKVSPDGIINTVYSAKTRWGNQIGGLALAPNGDIYVGGAASFRVFRLGANGAYGIVAGNGWQAYSGDGGPATQASLFLPWVGAVGKDRTLYIGDYATLRTVAADGIINTIAGGGSPADGVGDFGPARQAKFGGRITDVSTGPDGIYIADYYGHRVRHMGYPLLGFNSSDILISSEDSDEVYVFDRGGRHRQTVHALTKAVLHDFTYDARGYLIDVKDAHGNVTTLERDSDGKVTAIRAPDGQRTSLGYDADGYLAGVTNPADETTRMTYAPGGLLDTFANARGHASTLSYDPLGRLTADANAAGGSWQLARAELSNGHEISMRSALGRTTTYRLENLSTGTQKRTNTYPDGLQATTVLATNRTQTTTDRDKTITTLVEKPDPRFGMQMPLLDTTVRTPSGLVSTTVTTRSVVLSNAVDPLSVSTLTDKVTQNGKAWTSTYSAATKRYTLASPSARQSYATIDAQGQLVESQVAGLATTRYGYDPRGRVSTITKSADTASRTMAIDYNAEGYVSSITDPLSRSTDFVYDAVGRVTQQTLPDGRIIRYTYDANGNVTSITPPGRPRHDFAYTPVDLEAQYTPPDLGPGEEATRYAYNADKQLTPDRPPGRPARGSELRQRRAIERDGTAPRRRHLRLQHRHRPAHGDRHRRRHRAYLHL